MPCFRHTRLLWALPLLCMAAPAYAADTTAHFTDAQGRDLGHADLLETPHGVLIRLDLHDLPPGELAIHIHEHGKCSPTGADAKQNFTDAGGHLNPAGKEHGVLSDHGPHAGDMPNLLVDDDGIIRQNIINHHVTLAATGDDTRAALLDDSGAAIIIHAAADDYKSQPTGNAGDRIACAAITKSK